ncbi:hypothetical protein Tco_0149321 [Tanacetum coccineum]
MHGYGNLEIAKKLNDKIPKTVDEMFKRVRDFIRGKVAAGSAEMARPPQWDKGNTRQIEETVTSRKLAHLVKDIRQSNQRNGSQRRIGIKVINMVNDGRNRKRPYEGERTGLSEDLTFSAIPWNSLTEEPIILEGMIEGHQGFADRFLGRDIPPLGCDRPTDNHGGSRKEQNSAHGICNNQGVVTMETSKEALWKCKPLEKTQNSWYRIFTKGQKQSQNGQNRARNGKSVKSQKVKFKVNQVKVKKSKTKPVSKKC